MCTTNATELGLRGEAFDGFAESFDRVLAKTLRNMENKSSDEAAITMKIGISLETLSNPHAVDDGERKMAKPSFVYSISSEMKVKEKASGCYDEECQLIWDDDEGKYMMKKITNGQLELSDMEDEDIKTIAQYERLAQIVGVPLTIVEDLGDYTITTDDETEKIVFSSIIEENSSLYMSKDILKKHLEHEIECIERNVDEYTTRISIVCNDCEEELFFVERTLPEQKLESLVEEPEYEFEEDDYEYEMPEE